MKPWLKILVVVIVTVTLVIATGAGFFILNAKTLIAKQIEEATGKKTSIAAVGFIPPYGLGIFKVDIEGLAKIDSIYVSPSLIFLLTGRIGFNALILRNPRLSLEINPPTSPASLEKESVLSATAPPSKEKVRPGFFIKHLLVKGGAIDFFDKTVGQEGVHIAVKDISCSISNISSFILPQTTVFNIKATLPWQNSAEEGTIISGGRFNLSGREVKASVNVKGIDGIALYPYYAEWVDLKELRLQKAKLNFTSDIQSSGQQILAKCRLELTDIVRKPPEGQADKKEEIANLVLGILKVAGQDKLVFDFTVKAGFDKLKLSLSGIKLGAGR